ncbi:SDR family oxidoreductase [Planosporangium thailandense]|uniref:SDR family oxidoreductase n=1 Tax=Planosporangium thailandense TaxID=765197 RepID=A0ABX0XVF9_9ACTN|nr:SDR family oxidoreductase [Planosporangium thailandense]
MKQRIAIVTGAGSGIGQGIAYALVEAGYRVYATDISEARLASTKAAASSADDLLTRVLDVSDWAAVERVVADVVEHEGALDVMVNSAGVFDGYADVLETTPELWQRVIDVNLSGTFYGCRAAAQVMVKQGHGRIITIGSVAGQRGAADGLSYVASKAGIEGMHRRLAVDVAAHGVTANVVAPGVIKTNLRATSEELLGDLVADQNRGIGVSPDIWNFLIPTRRPGEVHEIASVVVFLASPQASYVNGQVIQVDGGWNAV